MSEDLRRQELSERVGLECASTCLTNDRDRSWLSSTYPVPLFLVDSVDPTYSISQTLSHFKYLVWHLDRMRVDLGKGRSITLRLLFTTHVLAVVDQVRETIVVFTIVSALESHHATRPRFYIYPL
jgi:hypothetical protein